jgi:hypothetical protein
MATDNAYITHLTDSCAFSRRFLDLRAVQFRGRFNFAGSLEI